MIRITVRVDNFLKLISTTAWDQLVENDGAGSGQQTGCAACITVHEQQVSTVEEFVYLGVVIHSVTQSTPDILHCSAVTAQRCRAWTCSFVGSQESQSQRSWSSTTPDYCQFSFTVQNVGPSPREMHARSMLSTNGASICYLDLSGTTLSTCTHWNHSGTAFDLVRAPRPNGW